MPGWLVNYLLPLVVPMIVQGLGPVIVEYMKKALAYVNAHLPPPVVAAVAAMVAVGVNEAQKSLTGMHFPPLVEMFVPVFGIVINELAAWAGKQPPTPGI